MPELRKYKPSVAPVDITGTTGTPGHMCVVIRSSAKMISGLSGDGLLGVASPSGETEIFGSPKTRVSVACTSPGESPGRMRQFTIARAVGGRAFSAWPASRRVATHVVLNSALSYGDFESRAAAAPSGGLFVTPFMSAAVWPV